MKIKVVVETQAEFDEWMKTQKPAFAKVNENEVQLEEVAPEASDSAKIENKEFYFGQTFDNYIEEEN